MQFQIFQNQDINKITSSRHGEKKIGESILAGEDYIDDLASCNAQYVLIGVPEDVGPRANCGRGGSDSAWEPFLGKFLNIQETELIKGSDILLYGKFDFNDLEGYGSSDLNKLRNTVSEIDKVLSNLIELIVDAGKTPIVIGGGHNNCYGIIRGVSNSKKQSINVCNLDPHADYRALEGRHSGNGFSYAKKEAYLDKYSILGLHENYNSQEMLEKMKRDGVNSISFEDIFLREKLSFQNAIDICKKEVDSKAFGIELDLDSLENFPSSAQTPSGITANQARQFIYKMANSKNACYLHLPEAAPSLVDGTAEQVGKLLAYLVSDFIKGKADIQEVGKSII
jgi:formiminoglutamase